MEPILISRKAAAQTLSISLRYLDQLIVTGRLHALRIGRRRLVSREELARFARASTIANGGGE
jgi:excisionase family DNA binding protein